MNTNFSYLGLPASDFHECQFMVKASVGLEPCLFISDSKSANPRNPRLKNSGPWKNFPELHPEFPGMGSEDQKLQTKNQTRTPYETNMEL